MSARLFDQLQNFRRNPSGSSGEGGAGGGNGGDSGKRPLAAPPADPETSRVKRALFGPVDHDENLRFVKRELQKTLVEQSKKYNFDFESGRPLKVEGGRWEWEVESRVPPLPTSPLVSSSSSSLASEPPPPQMSDNQGRKEGRRGDCDTTSIRGREAAKEPPPDSLLSGSPPSPTTATPVSLSSSAPPPCISSSPSSSSASTTTTTTAAATASKTSQRQTSITDHFSHRKRSRSKVKTQERKPEQAKPGGSDPEEEEGATGARPAEVSN